MLEQKIQNLMTAVQSLGPLDVLDAFILVGILYGVYRTIRNTRAVNLVRGLFILMLVFFLARAFNLHMLTYILERFVYFFMMTAAVIFAPDLRRALERIGNFHYFRGGTSLTNPQIDAVLKAVRETAGNLSRRRVGALMVFEKGSGLEEIAETGIILDARVSSALLINIFEKNTPLHDGAVLIRGNRAVAATCYLPLSEQSLSKELGTRHRAALGLSEQSDALVVVVSEQTGDISVARNGELLRYLTPADVEALLLENLYSKMEGPLLMRLVGKCFE